MSEMAAGTGTPYGSISLNNATFRAELTDTVQNQTISLSSLRGNAFQRFVIAADTANYNIRSAMVGAGWNGSSKASANLIINSGITVSASTTGVYALDSGSPWPAPSRIRVGNSGYVLGDGGDGGAGGIGRGQPQLEQPGFGGGGGGPGLISRRPLTIVGGIVAGGGGGGGGGSGNHTPGSPALNQGGSGGGGGATNRYPTAGGAGGAASGGQAVNGVAGQPGSWNAAGAGGVRPGTGAKDGGPGGGWGAAGTAGQNTSPAITGGAGGGAGISIQGWSVTSSSATLYGPVAG